MNHQIDQKYAAGDLWDKIDRQAEKDMDETLQATTRILGIADDAQKIGLNTLIELNQQGEKLQNIRKTVDEMETDVSYTKWLLRSGFGCCSCLWAPFKPKDKFDFIKVCVVESINDERIVLLPSCGLHVHYHYIDSSKP